MGWRRERQGAREQEQRTEGTGHRAHSTQQTAAAQEVVSSSSSPNCDSRTRYYALQYALLSASVLCGIQRYNAQQKGAYCST